MHEVVRDLLAGNAEHAARVHDRFDDLQTGQDPDAVTVCCSDSRVLQDHMWGNDAPGRLFTCSTIGNRVLDRTPEGDAVSGDVLYPIEHAGTDVAVVVGHTGCGAVTATYDDITNGRTEPAGIAHVLDLLGSHVEPGVELLPAGLSRAAAVNRLVEYNVDRQVAHLRGSDEVPDDVTVVGAVYDFQDVYGGRRGEVHLVNVDGLRAVEDIGSAHPEVEDRVDRLWEY